MADFIEDLGELPMDPPAGAGAAGHGGRFEDTADNGIAPEGMQSRHEDDDEGGEGIDSARERDADLGDEGETDGQEQTNANRDPNAANNEDDDDEDEDEDEGEDGEGAQGEGDDDEEDEEDEEEEEEGAGSSRPRKKKRRSRANRFLDIEVEVDEDDEDEDEEAGEAGFEEQQDYLNRQDPTRRQIQIADSFADDDIGDDDRDHRQLERRARDREEQEAQRIAQEYKERHRQRRGGTGIESVGAITNKNVLMPGVTDPSIWCVKCKIGRERELVMSISRKAMVQNLQITSAFQRDSFHGHLYIEARSEAHVRDAVAGLIGVYVSNAPRLVPLEEMPDLLKSRRKETPLQIGGWVRIKRGAYRGDLAQVDDVPEGGDSVTLKLVPRIDMQPKEDKFPQNPNDKKRRRGAENSLFRPKPALFNADDVRQKYAGKAKVVKDAEGYHFQGEVYAGGYLIKDFRMNNVERENVNPTIDEIVAFSDETAVASAAAGADGMGEEGAAASGIGSSRLDLNMVAEAAKAQTVLQPGDYVEIFEGAQKGIIGSISSVNNNSLLISPSEPADLVGTTIEVLASQVRKRFKTGDHVKVLRGKNVNESGLVLQIKGDLVTFLSDLSVQEVTVFSKDVREAGEVGAGLGTIGQYELHDLIQLDAETAACIFKVEPDNFRVIDQMGNVRSVRASQITSKIDTRRSVTNDHDNYELRSGDLVKEIPQGIRDPRQGRVLHVWRSLHVFLHNRDIVENGGVFVCPARALTSVAPRQKAVGDLSKMNPAMQAMPAQPTPMTGMPRREFALGLHVTVIKGNHKGYKGIIKDLNGPLARVELHTNNRTLTIERAKLGTGSRDNPNHIIPLEQWEREKNDRRAPPERTPEYNRAGQTPTRGTPMGGYGGITPFQAGKTPRYMGGATPFHGSSTPFGAGSSTPYMSGRTPAYGSGGDAFAAGSRTPYMGTGANAFSASSRTPYSGAAGGGGGAWGAGSATPTYTGSSAGNARSAAISAANQAWGSEPPNANPGSAWQSASPMHQPNGNATKADTWGSMSPVHAASAPTPWGAADAAPTPYASAPTPAPYASAPTPAAPTPYASAPTPYATAPTPAAGGDDGWGDDYTSAPTPAASAPTPYATAATPAASSWD